MRNDPKKFIREMKQSCKFIVFPCALHSTPELSILAKWVLISVDSVWDGDPQGISIGVQAIASLCNIKQKEAKAALNELYEHGAIEVTLIDGVKYIKPLMYKTEYKKAAEAIILGDSPRDSVETIDYEYIREQWNAICTTLPKVERMTTRRKTKTRTCLKGADASVQDLIKVFRLIACCSFLNGTKSTGWQCTYDWVTKSPDNFQKIFEGNYHSKDFNERQMFTAIINGTNIEKSDDTQDFYR